MRLHRVYTGMGVGALYYLLRRRFVDRRDKSASPEELPLSAEGRLPSGQVGESMDRDRQRTVPTMPPPD
jgi:hypothetical protein